MPRLPMTEVLISRTMARTRPDGVKTQLSVNFGNPAIDPTLSTDEQPMYYCPIQFVGFQDDMIYSLRGEDPLDALIAALCFAGPAIKSTPYADQLDEWNAAMNFGFPINFPLELPPDGGGHGQPGGGGGNGNPGAGG